MAFARTHTQNGSIGPDVKRGKSRDKRKRSKRKFRGVLDNLAHVSKHAVVLGARSSAARVYKSAQVTAADDNEDSDAKTRQVKRKSKKLKKSNRGSCSSFGMAGTGDDSDDAGDDEDDKRIRKAFQSASASAFHFGSGGRAASCIMARAKATYVPNHVSRQSSFSRAGSAFSVQVVHLVSPPQELRHVIPEYFMLCDSGATHHMLSDMMFFAHLRDKYLQVSWGDSSTSHSLGIGHLVFLGYFSSARSGRAAPKPCILTCGTDDALLVPDCTRSLCSLTRFSAQGRTVHLNESNPGIVLRDGKGFIPCCLESETGYVLLPCFPPPSSATFVRTPREMPVIDFNASVTSGTYVSALDATTFCAAAADSF